jgi:hypothetical protein
MSEVLEERRSEDDGEAGLTTSARRLAPITGDYVIGSAWSACSSCPAIREEADPDVPITQKKKTWIFQFLKRT